MTKKVTNNVKVKCLTTGTYFSSISDLQKTLGIAHGWINKCFGAKGQFIDKAGNVYVKTNATQITADKKSKAEIKALRQENIKRALSFRKKPVICNETGKVFDSIKSAAKSINLNSVFVSAKSINLNSVFVSAKLKKHGIISDRKGHTYSYVNANTNSTKNTIKNKVAIKTNITNEKSTTEKTALEATVISFIKKGMYSEASTLCESLQKIYMKK